MLKDKDSSAIVAVSDINRARTFYGEILELEIVSDSDDMFVCRTGATKLVVYVSTFAGTNKANAVVWGVGDEIEEIVGKLAQKGVTFERYDGMEYSNGIHSDGDFRMVWLKDPDGNFLHFNNM